MSVINNKVGLLGDLALSMVESNGLVGSKKVQAVSARALERSGPDPAVASNRLTERRCAPATLL
jgi:hypothetical protein